LHPRCATRGTLDTEPRRRQARFAGSFRERRGRVLAELRGNSAAEESALDRAALASLVKDGLAIVTGGRARLP
jgi:hypothetical protein